MNMSITTADVLFPQAHFTARSAIKHRNQALNGAQSRSLIPPTPLKKRRYARSAFINKRKNAKAKQSMKGKSSLMSSISSLSSISPKKRRKRSFGAPKLNFKRLNSKSKQGHCVFANMGFIGAGSFSTVYKIVNVASKRTYALKESLKPLCFRGLAESSLREVEIVKRINSHYETQGVFANERNVVFYHDYWFGNENRLYQLYDCYSHGTLLELIQCNHRLNSLQVISIMRQLLEGLTAIHDTSVIHLDLKPSNIFIDNNCVLKIGDFGISIFENDPTNANLSLFEHTGDPIYIAPEVLNSFSNIDVVSSKTDIYSLAIMFMELLVDIRAPASGPHFENLRNGKVDFDYLNSISPRCPPTNDTEMMQNGELLIRHELENLCKQMLAVNPNERPSAKQAVNVISAICSNAFFSEYLNEMEGVNDIVLPAHIDQVRNIGSSKQLFVKTDVKQYYDESSLSNASMSDTSSEDGSVDSYGSDTEPQSLCFF